MSPCHVVPDSLSHENPRNKNFMSLGIDCMIYVYVDAMQDMGWGARQTAFSKCKGLYNHCEIQEQQ
jgi:hypothetical protein